MGIKKNLVMDMMGILVVMLTLTGCKSADVVGKVSVSSFEAVLKTSEGRVLADPQDQGWALGSPGKERWIWSRDFSQTKMADVMLEVEAKPFLAAGLDLSKLDQKVYHLDQGAGTLRIVAELGNDKFSYSGEARPIDSFEQLVATHRDRIKYHEALDHYGVMLGGGNMLEWAKDMAKNDKDLVFVLNPKPFIDAGVDPSKVEGWIFTKVEVKNDKGQKELVDKFLKPYNLK